MRRKFTRMMLLAVSALGLCSTALLFSDPPPPSDFDMTPTIFSVNSTALTNNRNLANINPNEGAINPYETLLNLNCSAQSQILETTSIRFRLKGENCATDEQNPVSTQVRNKSNGYVATVFHRNPAAFTTDYINLSEGKNEIEVRFEGAQGTTEKTLTILRSPATAISR